ncbi:uncharacterized protein METZ01_LOCUS269316, partial [marine metagenome]
MADPDQVDVQEGPPLFVYPARMLTRSHVVTDRFEPAIDDLSSR